MELDGADDIVRAFFASEEYAAISPRQLVDSASLRDDLWMDDLALLDLADFIEEAAPLVKLPKRWDGIQTLGDLKQLLPKSTLAPRVPCVKGRCRWIVRVGDWQPSEAEFEKALRLVPEERREKTLRFRQPSDQRLHFCGRLMLRRIIHQETGLPYQEINFGYTKGNKPVLATPMPPTCSLPNFNFNYSHDGDYLVGATEPCSIVGVDVARIEVRGRQRSVDEHFSTMKNCFSAREWNVIREPDSDSDKLRRFFTFWALKESYVKASGWGLGTDFDTFEFRNVLPMVTGNHSICVIVKGVELKKWHFRIYNIDPMHVMCVATGPPEEAAPTFKATFKLAPNDLQWQESPAPTDDCDHVRELSVADLMQGVPEYKD